MRGDTGFSHKPEDQPDQPCHKWDAVAECWDILHDCLAPLGDGFTGEGYCPTCGARLNADGTTQAMVPENVVCGCAVHGDALDCDVEDVSAGQTVVSVRPCGRCLDSAAQAAYHRGKTGSGY